MEQHLQKARDELDYMLRLKRIHEPEGTWTESLQKRLETADMEYHVLQLEIAYFGKYTYLSDEV